LFHQAAAVFVSDFELKAASLTHMVKLAIIAKSALSCKLMIPAMVT